MSKEGYGAEYKASRIQTWQTITKIKQKIKRTRRHNRKIDRSNHSIN